MSQASFVKYPRHKITKYEPKHKWICLNLIMETTLKLIPKPLQFDINDTVNVCEFTENSEQSQFNVPFVQCLISKIHKKLQIIISKETVESLWNIAKIVIEYQLNKTHLEGIVDCLFDCDFTDELIENNPDYIRVHGEVGKYKSMLKELGYKTKFIPSYVKFYFK